MQPYCCPVCQGRGTKPYSFYGPPTPGTSFGAITCDVMCRSCTGTGIVWHGDDEPHPGLVASSPPFGFGGGLISYGSGNTLTIGAGSFTALQGIVPINHPACSVESPPETDTEAAARIFAPH